MGHWGLVGVNNCSSAWDLVGVKACSSAWDFVGIKACSSAQETTGIPGPVSSCRRGRVNPHSRPWPKYGDPGKVFCSRPRPRPNLTPGRLLVQHEIWWGKGFMGVKALWDLMG